jgi:hypothetical protein
VADHRDGPRLINTLFPIFQGLDARQQAVFTRMFGLETPADTSGFKDTADLDEEVEEARQHFLARIGTLER